MEEDHDIESDPDNSAADEGENSEALEAIKEHFDQEERDRIDASESDEVAVETLFNNYMDNQEVVMAQLPADGPANNRQDIADLNENLRELNGLLRQQVREATQGPRQHGILRRYLTVGFGVVTVASAVIGFYFAVKSVISEGENAFALVGAEDAMVSKLPNPDTPATRKLVANWKRSDERDFWTHLAKFVGENKPRSFEEQLLFMQYTEDLALPMMAKNFGWKNAEAKVDLITSLTEAIHKTGLAKAYKLIPTLKIDGRPLPRAVAANVMSFALVNWWKNYG